MISNKEWLAACQQLLTEYEEDKHIANTDTCTLCELSRRELKNVTDEDCLWAGSKRYWQCVPCIWIKFTGGTCGDLANLITNHLYWDEGPMNAEHWREFRILHLQGWIERLKNADS